MHVWPPPRDSGWDCAPARAPATRTARSQAQPARPTRTRGTGGCVAWTCEKLGAECGQAPDGCGGVLECGSCSAGLFCGGKGANRCGTEPCAKKTCASAKASCSYVSDGCGSVIDCGACQDGEVCEIRTDSQYCKFDGCNGTDFCQSRGLKSGWHCDVSARVRCAEQGEVRGGSRKGRLRRGRDASTAPAGRRA